MRSRHLLKQGLAVLLSLSMSLGPCAPSFAAFAAEAEYSAAAVAPAGADDSPEGTAEAVSATSSDAEKRDSGSEAAEATPADALYDEDGFLLDGTVSDDRPEEEKTEEEKPEEELTEELSDILTGDWNVLQAEAEQIKVTVRAEKDVLPENTVLEAELQEEAGDISLVQLRFLDENGDEIQPDRDKGRLYVTFEGLERPEDADGRALPDDALTVWGLKYVGDDEGKELEKVDEEEDLLLSGAILSAGAAEGGIINDLEPEADAETGTASDAAKDDGPVSVTVKAAEGCAVFALAWSMAGALLKATAVETGYAVTFDYGTKPVWEENGHWYALHAEEYGVHPWTFETKEEAEAQGIEKTTIYVQQGESLLRTIDAPKVPVSVDGKQQIFSTWQGDDGTVCTPEELSSYTPERDVTFQAQWNANFVTVTADYGEKLVWAKDGEWHWMESDGINAVENWHPDRATAEENAVDHFNFYVEPGKELNCSFWSRYCPLMINGEQRMMTGWLTDTGETVALGAEVWYIPSEDVTFHMQWSSDIYEITFDFGEKLVWEQNGYYYSVCYESLPDDAWAVRYMSYEEAETNAADVVRLHAAAGEALQKYNGFPSEVININGQPRKLTGWENDSGEFLATEDVYNYVPTGNVTFRPKWATDFYTVTFDYGDRMIWESDGVFSAVTGNPESNWIEQFGTKEEAQAAAVRTVSFRVIQGESLMRTIVVPTLPVSVDGKQQIFSTWQGADGTSFTIDDLYWYTPERDVTFQAQWNSDFVAVTADYGEKLVWEKDGEWHWIVTDGNNAWDNASSERSTAEENALDHLTYYVEPGKELNHSFWDQAAPMTIDGQTRMMTGWVNDDGEILELGTEATYIPSGDVTFHAQWSSDIYEVTFDFGETLVWEQDGFYNCVYYNNVSDAAWTTGYMSYEEAEANAADVVRLHTPAGEALQKSISFPTEAININGQPRKLKGWESDSGEFLALGNEYSYVPSGNVTFRPQWATEFYTVTFDYGDGIVWESDGGFSAVTGSGESTWTEQFGTREEAQAAAVRTISFRVLQGDSLSNSVTYPDNAVTLDGQTRMMTGWQNDGGEQLTAGNTWSYVPAGDATFRPVWASDLYKVTIDYGSRLVWENTANSGWYYFINKDGYVSSVEDRELAEYEAVQEITFHVEKGKTLNREIGQPYGFVFVDGKPVQLTGFKIGSDVISSGYQLRNYIPRADIVIDVQWAEAWTVTLHENSGPAEDESTYPVYVRKGESQKFYPSNGSAYQFTRGEDQLIFGWSTERDTSVSELGSNTFTPEGDMDLYAIWGRGCVITFDLDGGNLINGQGTETRFVRFPGEAFYLEEFSAEKPGNKFECWIDQETGERVYNGRIFPQKDITLKAKFSGSVTVTFVENFEGSTEEWTRDYADNWEIKVPRFFTQEGYALLGYSRDKNASEPEYVYGSWFRPEAGMKLYGIWKKSWTLTIDMNGGELTRPAYGGAGSGTVFERMVFDNTSVAKELSAWYTGRTNDGFIPLCEGKVFGGWCYDAEGTQDVKEEDLAAKDLNIYAKWVDGWHVTVDYGDYDIYPSDPEREEVENLCDFYVKKGESLTQPGIYFETDQALTVTGYQVDGEIIQTLEGYTPSKDVDIKAVIVTENLVKLTFHEPEAGRFYTHTCWEDHGSKKGEGICWLYTEKGSTLNTALMPLPGWEGYRDNLLIPGWSLTEGGNVPVDFSTHKFTQDTDLYPIEKKAVSVGFVLSQKTNRKVSVTFPESTRSIRNGEKGNYVQAFFEKGSLVGCPEDTALTCDDLVFQGWYKNADYIGDPIFIPSSRLVADKDMTLYAKWGVRVDVTGVALDQEVLNLKTGDEKALSAKVLPEDATNQNVTWSSSDAAVASVDETGKVKAVKAGTADITVTTEDGGFTAVCRVTVIQPVTGVSLDKTENTAEAGTEFTLTATVAPDDAANKNVAWSSSDTSVASVDRTGKVKALKAGTADITVTTEDGGFTAVCKVTVTQKVTGVSLDKSEGTVETGSSLTLTATVKPANATNQKVTWSSSDTKIATVAQNGKVTGVKAGTANITVTTEDGGFKAVCKVTVIQRVTGVTISRTTNEVTEGESFTLTANVVPADATNKKVTWSSSDTKVATVDQNGKVTAVKAGIARITVITEDGSKTSYCNVSVKSKDLKSAFIERLYRTCLNREADAGGLNYWLGLVNSGSLKGITLAGKFVFSPEFTGKNYCDEHFVKQLYVALMDREADAGGLGYWTGRLANGEPRERIMNDFTSSVEYKKMCSDAGIALGARIKEPKYGTKPYGACAVCGEKTKVVQFVERTYKECMGRAADEGGLKYWSKGLYEHTKTGKSLVTSFVLSTEMKNKKLSSKDYISAVYRVMLGREADQGGLNYWQGLMKKGKTIEDVINGFVDSKEFTRICNDYGIQRK